MARVLIVYGTAYGQTERIAHEIARVLREAEHEVSLVRGDRPPAGLALEEYDGAVVAASVLYGRHQRYIERFVRERATRLNAMPSAFVSVCGAMANPAPDAERVARGYRERLLAAAGWRPTIERSFAGGVPYTRYRPWVRWMIKMISRRNGGPTDTSRDYDFTDWPAVSKFAQQFAGLLPGARDGLVGGTPVAAGAPKADLDELC
ncbi:MAG TPA: flavodoxin domain-containing protein [Gemmatimonadales bacterium]|jgi:menaquinone-dependent protoporphyrinogen oxidase|nr:flavodoxin domain-containing protein [Gemmatimonadales bacterium]